MYLLEWGTGFGRDNPDSGLYRIDYTTAVTVVRSRTASGTPPQRCLAADGALLQRGLERPRRRSR